MQTRKSQNQSTAMTRRAQWANERDDIADQWLAFVRGKSVNDEWPRVSAIPVGVSLVALHDHATDERVLVRVA